MATHYSFNNIFNRFISRLFQLKTKIIQNNINNNRSQRRYIEFNCLCLRFFSLKVFFTINTSKLVWGAVTADNGENKFIGLDL